MSGVIATLLGQTKSPRELLREYKRNIDRTVRDLDRERATLQAQEKKIITEIRQMARKGQTDAVKIMARDLVRVRNYVTKFHSMKAQMQAVSLRLTTLATSAQMSEAMKGCTRAMVSMNRQINLPAMRRIMMEFEKQSEIMTLKEEVMNECIDDAMDEDGTEATETEGIVAQIMDELGIEIDEIKGGSTRMPEVVPDDDLMSRLENLGAKKD